MKKDRNFAFHKETFRVVATKRTLLFIRISLKIATRFCQLGAESHLPISSFHLNKEWSLASVLFLQLLRSLGTEWSKRYLTRKIFRVIWKREEAFTDCKPKNTKFHHSDHLLCLCQKMEHLPHRVQIVEIDLNQNCMATAHFTASLCEGNWG